LERNFIHSESSGQLSLEDSSHFYPEHGGSSFSETLQVFFKMNQHCDESLKIMTLRVHNIKTFFNEL